MSAVERQFLTLLHSERPKLYTILAFLSAIGLKVYVCFCMKSVLCCCSIVDVYDISLYVVYD